MHPAKKLTSLFAVLALLGFSPANSQIVSGSVSATNGSQTICLPPPVTPGVPGQTSPGKPVGTRFWFSPDKVTILKIRGDFDLGGTVGTKGTKDSESRTLIPLLTWNQRMWGGPSVLPWFKVNKDASEFSGWGESIPSTDKKFISEGTVKILGDSLAGAKTDRPYDTGLTRYEMWVGKSFSPNNCGLNFAWFFDSYNVVTQGGELLGSLKVTTADSLNPQRAFRDTPYLVDAEENSSMLRTYAASTIDGKTSLVSQPKLLVLTSPDYGKNNQEEIMIGSASAERTKLGNLEMAPARKYRTKVAEGSLLAGIPSINDQLAPNVSIADAGPTAESASDYKSYPLSKNWHYDPGTKKWAFRRWQRAEVLDAFPSKSHVWALETKEDLLYAPQSNDTALNPSTYKILDPATPVAGIQGMLVGSHVIRGFDTGGIRVGTANFQNGAVYNDIGDIPDLAAINVLPIGLFYPEAAIVVALEAQLLKKDAGGKTVPDGDWKTLKAHYWLAANSTPVDTDVDQSMSPRQVVFGPSSGGKFDPYVHGWVFPVKDFSQTSARYRLRVFFGFPFRPIDINDPALKGAEKILPSSLPGVSLDWNGDKFTEADMVKVLQANNNNPINPISREPDNIPNVTDQAIRAQISEYKDVLEKLSLSQRGAYVGGPVVQTATGGDVEAVLEDVVGTSVGADLPSSDLAFLSYPFGVDETKWFEYNIQSLANWTVEVPDITIGVDAEGAGVIITE